MGGTLGDALLERAQAPAEPTLGDALMEGRKLTLGENLKSALASAASSAASGTMEAVQGAARGVMGALGVSGDMRSSRSPEMPQESVFLPPDFGQDVKRGMGVQPQAEGTFLFGKLPSFAGGALPFLAAPELAPATGAAMFGEQGYQETLAETGDKSKATVGGLLQAIPGAAGAMLLGRLARFPTSTQGLVKTLFLESQAASLGLGAQTAIYDAIQEQLTGKDKDIFKDAWETYKTASVGLGAFEAGKGGLMKATGSGAHALAEGAPESGTSDATKDKGPADLVVAGDAERAGNASIPTSGIVESNGGVNVPGKHPEAASAVKPGVVAVGNNGEIGKSVVGLDPVDVVDVLGGKKSSSEGLLHDEPVLKHGAPEEFAADVSVPIDASNPLRVPEAGTRAVGISKPTDVAGLSSERLPAPSTLDRQHDVAPTSDVVSGAEGAQTSSGPDILAKAEPERGPTSIRNAEVDRERTARGLEPLMGTLRKSDPETFDSAMKRLDEDPMAGQKLVDELSSKVRPMSDEEDILLTHRKVEVANELSRIDKGIADAREAGDAELLDALQEQRKPLSNLQSKIDELGESAGAETARGLRMRRFRLAMDFTPAEMEITARADAGGRQMEPEEIALIRERSAKLLDLTAKIQEAEAKAAKGQAAKNIQTPGKRERIISFLDAQAEQGRAHLKGKLGRAGGGIPLDPADIIAAAKIGAAHLAHGIDAGARLVAEFGEAIKPYLQEILAKAEEIKTEGSLRSSRAAGQEKRYKALGAKYAERRAAGDFEPAPKREHVPLTPEVLKAKADFEQERRLWQGDRAKWRRENRTTGQKVGDAAKEALNLPKALMTAFDFSAVLRQGGFFSLGHPVETAKSFPKMFAATFSERKALETDVAIRNREHAALGNQAKLELTELGGTLGKQEEAIRSQWSDKIPGIRASNRAFITFLNMQRATTFDAMVDAVPGGATPEQARAIANLVNIGTGRGDPGRFASAVGAASNVLWSPRLLLSRFQLLAGQPLYRGDAVTRKAVAKQYARSLAGVAAVYALGKLIGGDEEKDPRSSDFGKIKLGDTRIDPLAGLSQVTVFLSREASGETKTGKGEIVPIRGNVPYGHATGWDVATRFLRSKLSPTLGVPMDVLSGENAAGQPVTPESVAKGMLVPLSFQDILSAMEDRGIPEGVALGLLSTFGMGLQSYKTAEPKPRRSLSLR